MSPVDLLMDLLAELDRTHDAGYASSEEFRSNRDFPDFVTAANGEQRNYYLSSRTLLASLTTLVYEQAPAFNKRIDLKQFAALVRQVVANMHAAEAFAGKTSPLPILLAELTVQVDRAVKVFTHSFPAWTCGVERAGEWVFGPVTFMSWPQWLTHVDFSDGAKPHFLGEPEANARWKELLLEVIADPKLPDPPGLASEVIDAVRTCPAVLRVEVRGLERHLSRKLGEIVCKAALDAVSVLLGQRQSFTQQALQVERLPPIGITTLTESDGHLWHAGHALTDRMPSLARDKRTCGFVKDHPTELGAMAHAVCGLLDPAHPHPQLASRWATALDWYAEGQRERNDAIALAKIGTCLDVLASGGKLAGILKLLTNLLDVAEDAGFTRGTKKTTLKAVAKDIYNSGRSQILHGTRHDRMESFESDRGSATYLARFALLDAALRLETYTGPDEAEAFLTMPPRAP